MERDKHYPLPLCQQLRQVGMVDSQIPFPHHGHYPLLHPSRGRVGWVPTSIPVAKGGAPSFRYAARIRHTCRSLTPRTSAASRTNHQRSSTAFKICNLVCSLVVNVSPSTD